MSCWRLFRPRHLASLERRHVPNCCGRSGALPKLLLSNYTANQNTDGILQALLTWANPEYLRLAYTTCDNVLQGRLQNLRHSLPMESSSCAHIKGTVSEASAYV